MDALALGLVALNLAVSTMTFLAVIFRPQAGDDQTYQVVPRGNPQRVMARTAGKRAPIWNDELKEYHAEREHEKNRTPF